MRPRSRLLLIGLTVLAGCVAPGAEAPPVAPAARAAGGNVDGVLGGTARTLITLLGQPALDWREGPARKLQFLGPACVLDAYLYPPRSGAEPVVTHVDARQPDGREMDRASCVAALSARAPAR